MAANKHCAIHTDVRLISAARARRGLSLLELVLALALSVLVIGLVCMAMRIQLQSFQNRRDRIDQASLGRSILRHIADDLRCAIANRPIDLQGVSTVTGNATQNLGGAMGLGTSGGQPSSTGQPASGTQTAPNTTSGSATAANPMGTAGASGTTTAQSGSNSSAQPTTGGASGQGAYVAGLYGDQYSVQFDMTRLPRLDEYSAIVSDIGANPISQIPTDIRTVSYYLAGSTPMTQASAALSRESGIMPMNQNAYQDLSQPPEAQGLVRQERDRAVASYSQVSVDYSDWTSDTGEELLADEVTRLEFQYFDGYQWWPSWDSDDRGGLPVAIEIVIGMLDRKAEEESNTFTWSADGQSQGPKELYYRLVVRIPTGEPLDPYATEEEETTADPNATNANANGSTNTTNQNATASMGASPMGMGGTPGAVPAPGGATAGPGGGGAGGPGGGGGRGSRGGGQNPGSGGRGGGGQRGGGGGPGAGGGGGQRGGGGGGPGAGGGGGGQRGGGGPGGGGFGGGRGGGGRGGGS